jgi:archaellum biogenesis ATPase FlaH
MQVRYKAIVMQSGDAIGDAERTSGSFANQMRALKAGISDTVSELGMQFLPVATEFINKMNKNMPQIKIIIENVFKAISKGVKLAVPVFEMIAGMFTLIITKTGYCDVTPAVGSHQYNEGDIVPITVT